MNEDGQRFDDLPPVNAYLLTLPESAHYSSVLTSIRQHPDLNVVEEKVRAPEIGIYGLLLPEDTPLKTIDSINELDFVSSLELDRGYIDRRIVFETPEQMQVDPVYVTRSRPDPLSLSIDSDLDIAIVDGGLDTRNPNLNEVKDRYNYVGDPELDWNGHGTAVALIRQKTFPKASFFDMKVSRALLDWDQTTRGR